MRRRPTPAPRGTAVLLGVLALLGAYLWVFELGAREAVPPPIVDGQPLLPASPAAVARVELADPGTRLGAQRAERGWNDAAGRPWRTGPVADLLDTLAALRPLMIVDDDPGAPIDYGFGADASRLEVAAADGRPLLALEIGERNPAGTGLYVRRSGERAVMLVGAVLGWELDKLRAAAPVLREPGT